MEKDIWQRRAARLFCFCVYGGAGYLFITLVLPAVFPVIAAFMAGAGVFFASERAARRFGLPQSICAAGMIGLALFSLCLFVTLVCRALFGEIGRLIDSLSQGAAGEALCAAEQLELVSLVARLLPWGEDGEGMLSEILMRAVAALGELVGAFVAGIVRRTPDALISGAVMLFTFLYASFGARGTLELIEEMLPRGARLRIREELRGAPRMVRRLVGAYVKLYALTFFPVLMGLLVLCPSYSLLGAFAVATVDLLPVLGAGAVLIPWGLCAILLEEYFLGVGLLLLYLTVTVVRQIAEPRILGGVLRLPPLVALTAMFVGYRLSGVAGMLLLPLAVSALRYRRGQTKGPHPKPLQSSG